MATLLEKYIERKNSFDGRMQAAMPSPDDVWQQQELLYRIEVLEACQMLGKAAPRSADPKDLCWHYQMADAYFQNLTLERRYGASADEKLKQQRETAHGSLLCVIQAYRKNFASFAPGNDADCYRKEITKVIQTVLAVWIQYRQTYVEIIREAA